MDECVQGRHGRSRGTDTADAPSTAATSSAPSEPLVFTLDDLDDARTTLGVGDSVGAQLCVNAATGKVRVTRLRLVAAAVEERERGVAHVVKDHFGFLRCETREGQLFFHFAELEGRERAGRQLRAVDDAVSHRRHAT